MRAPVLVLLLLVVGCASAPRKGGYYKDDGPTG